MGQPLPQRDIYCVATSTMRGTVERRARHVVEDVPGSMIVLCCCISSEARTSPAHSIPSWADTLPSGAQSRLCVGAVVVQRWVRWSSEDCREHVEGGMCSIYLYLVSQLIVETLQLQRNDGEIAKKQPHFEDCNSFSTTREIVSRLTVERQKEGAIFSSSGMEHGMGARFSRMSYRCPS